MSNTISQLELQQKQQAIWVEIRRERLRQDEQWGGPEHDDAHEPIEWESFIDSQTKELTTADYTVGPHYREQLVKIAALAVAAIESHDRKSGK